MLPEFAKYLLRSGQFRSRLANSIKRAVNQASVSIGDLKAIPVSIPPLPKQRRIAEILGQSERAARRVALIAQLRRSPNPILPTCSVTGGESEEWPVTRVGEVADVQGGLQVTSERQSLSRETAYSARSQCVSWVP